MRYRKRINLSKGLGLNLSKSGISFSLGVKGASVTVGKSGVYQNIGLPGTGLYSRNKISGSRKSGSGAAGKIPLLEVRFNIDDDGKIIIKDKDELEITDEALLRKIKHTVEYKQAAQQLFKRKHDQIEAESEKFINIYQFTPKFKNEAFWFNELNQLKHLIFIEEKYKIEKPEIGKVKQKLIEITNKKIKSILFWTNKKRRAQYIKENLDEFYEIKVKEWEDALAKHGKSEEDRKIRIVEYNKDIDKKRGIIENCILKGDDEFINNSIQTKLNDIELPVEFSIDYEYDPKGHLFVDLDLPEIEDLPTAKAQILQSGKISIKNKNLKELKKDYATCVCGLAFYFAGEFFNISPMILSITISGYTQRPSPKTGNIEDQYVYSVIFKREIFDKLNIQKIDPIRAFENFESFIHVNSAFELKTITPFGINKTANP